MALPLGPGRAASAAVQATFLGVLLGLLRHASRSLLAPMVASVALSAVGVVVAAGLAERVPIPGFNAGGDHTPPWILAACAAPVALGVASRCGFREREPGVTRGYASRPVRSCTARATSASTSASLRAASMVAT
jgi:hypothetical protein